MSVYDQLQFDTVRREQEQVQRNQAAENARLDVADYQTYRRLRLEHPILEPELPLDEASYRDYCLRRDAGEGK